MIIGLTKDIVLFHISNGMTRKQIAAKYHCKPSYIKYMLCSRFKSATPVVVAPVKINPVRQPSERDILADKIRILSAKELTRAAVANELGIPKGRVESITSAYGIKSQFHHKPGKPSHTELLELLKTNNCAEIAVKFKSSKSAVEDWVNAARASLVPQSDRISDIEFNRRCREYEKSNPIGPLTACSLDGRQ